MFDLNTINKRYFTVKIGEYTIDIEPCKLKTIRKFQNYAKNAGDCDLVDILVEVFNKNKTKFKIPREVIEDLDFDEMQELLLAYFEWIEKTKSSSPN